MATTKTSTYTKTYTKPRIDVLEDHFEMFLRCAGMNDKDVEKFLHAVEHHELQAVGVYIEEENYRIAEVEFEVDWNTHVELTRISGNIFDTDLPGWKDGVAPEAYVAVSRLAKAAKAQNLKLRSWIRVSQRVRESPNDHKRVCEELGYLFGSTVNPWRNPPTERARQIEGLAEAKVISREAR